MKIKLTVVATLLMMMYACNKVQKPKGLIPYNVVKSEITENPTKTIVDTKVIVEENTIPSVEDLKTLINYVYDSVAATSNYDYHDNPTNIYVNIYNSKDKALNDGDFLINIVKTLYEDKPDPYINTFLIEAGVEEPRDRWNLSHVNRVKLFKETRKAYYNNSQEDYKLIELDIIKNNNVEAWQIDSIISEGNKYGWAWKN